MPILETAPASRPLSQGDVLANLQMYVTGLDGRPMLLAKRDYCLVLSPDCVAMHKGKINVIPIGTAHVEFPSIKGDLDRGARLRNYEEVLAALETVRNGTTQPDRLYLGTLAGQQERLAGYLDELTTICIPKDEQELQAWTINHRVARLSPDFLRDLPVRLHKSVARVGFDDHSWFCSVDLRVLLNAGRGALRELEAIAEDKALVVGTLQDVDDKRRSANEKDLQAATKKLNDLKERLRPYEDELARRDALPLESFAHLPIQ